VCLARLFTAWHTACLRLADCRRRSAAGLAELAACLAECLRIHTVFYPLPP
jgi:hypothetical protein